MSKIEIMLKDQRYPLITIENVSSYLSHKKNVHPDLMKFASIPWAMADPEVIAFSFVNDNERSALYVTKESIAAIKLIS